MIPVAIVFLAILALNLYALTLVCARGFVYRVRIYRPMLLNIALSVAPVVVLALTVGAVLFAVIVEAIAAVWVLLGIGLLVWLVLLPNTAYLITELNMSHRRDDDPVPMWFDIVQVLTLALSGVVNSLGNIALLQIMFVAITAPNDPAAFSRPLSWVVAGGVMVLIPVGIYLGRYLRFNSWDIVRPRSFWSKLAVHFRIKGNAVAAVGFVVTHAILLAILYLMIFPSLLIATW